MLQEENQRDSVAHNTISHESMAMNVSDGQFQGYKNKSHVSRNKDKKSTDASIVCDYCALTGHTREKCFALHGYPEWHRLHGHPKPKIRTNNKKTAAHVISNAVPEMKSESAPLSSSHNASDNLLDVQCHQLIQMLQSKLSNANNASAYAQWITNAANSCAGINSIFSSNSVIFASHTQFNSTKHTWIIDSGATHHITPYIDIIDNPYSVNSELHLPNGDISIVSHIGNVSLPNDIVLKDVLVVPTFQCNLLSVPQLTKSLSCKIVFLSTKCIL